MHLEESSFNAFCALRLERNRSIFAAHEGDAAPMWTDTGHGHLVLRGVVAGIDEVVGVIPQPVALVMTWHPR